MVRPKASKDGQKILQNDESFPATVDLIKNYAIFTLDLEGRITSWNKGAEKLNGWKKDEVLGRYFDFLYTDQDRQNNRPERNLKLASQKGDYEEEGYRVNKSGGLYLADITMSQIHDDETGEHIGYIKIVKDVTQRRQAETDQIDANSLLKQEIVRRQAIEKALKESNDELEAFASAASHDLQEPLRMVVSYLQLIEKRYSGKFDQDGLDFLNFAIDGATRMKSLISDLVVYSRIDNLKKPYKTVDTNKLLKRVLSNLALAISDASADVTFDALPQVWSDEVQLNQIYQNLVSNALKYGRPDTPLKIHIGVKDSPSEYTFFVRDNGRGINKKHFKMIFLIFKQLGDRNTRRGSGVGLALVKKIVTRHGGRIWVESGEGQGSTFYFTIPRNDKVKDKGDKS